MIDITGGTVIINVNDDGINASLIGSNGEDVEVDSKSPQNEIPILPAEEETNEIEYINDDVTVGAEDDSENDEEEYNTENATEFETKVPTEVAEKFEASQKHTNYYDKQVYVRITGGKVQITVIGNNIDGIDSNGSIYFGGNSVVFVSTSYGGIFGNMGAFDSIGSKTLNIGTTALLTSTGKFAGSPDVAGSTPSVDELTVDDILKLYPNRTRESAEELLEKIKKLEQTPAMNNGIYDEPNTGKCLQPFIRTTLKSQEKGTPIKILDNESNVLIEYTPKADYAILLFTSPEIVIGETYTVITGDVTETAIAQVDTPEDN